MKYFDLKIVTKFYSYEKAFVFNNELIKIFL